MEPIDTAAELKSGKTEKDIIAMLYKRITDTGTEVMGYDVRDPKYVATLETAHKEKTIKDSLLIISRYLLIKIRISIF